MQLPFLFVNSAMAGLLGALFNSLRMWLWKVRSVNVKSCQMEDFRNPLEYEDLQFNRSYNHWVSICFRFKIRASKTLHLQRIAEVIGLMFLTSIVAFFFSAVAGQCLKTPDDWFHDEAREEYEYGIR
jgi:chloride channel 7